MKLNSLATILGLDIGLLLPKRRYNGKFGPYKPHQGKRECARRLAKPLHQPTGNGDQYKARA